MNAHVENQTVQSNNHYCYHMTLEHKGKYDIHLKGHLNIIYRFLRDFRRKKEIIKIVRN
jgi:hypothetical protein